MNENPTIGNHQYDDIIDLPHHVSQRHKPMPLYERAAQFAPFAALTGHQTTERAKYNLEEHITKRKADELL